MYRFERHFVFWLAVFLYHFIRISFLYPPGHFFQSIPSIIAGALFWGVLLNMTISYTIIYFLVPKFFVKKKYFNFLICLLLLLIVVNVFEEVNLFINSKMTSAIGVSGQDPFIYFKASMIRLLGNPPLICLLLLSLKKIKDWYVKQKENKILIIENNNAELQLLKAQIHPHFLFNTLNNIYFFILSEPLKAKSLVIKLENLLYYMINECNVPLVPLSREISMIHDYFELEKVRYNNLDIELKITGESTDKMIAPLLMIPFIENSFKHGTSKVLREPWIKLFLQIDIDMLHFTLANNKPTESAEIKNAGIGLNNVKKRLVILHPKNHYLKIEPTPNSFTVNMQIPLK
ncbi:MAG: histidine kinase [Bacteroidota bacterium]|nr:histidine kinase [Bacteroidota bacterium]